MREFAKLERLISELQNDSRPKIVEGKKDKKALEYFGITNIITLDKKLSEIPFKIREKPRQVIILTDFDRTGRSLARRLVEIFAGEGISADLMFRKELKKLTGIREIEELAEKYEKMKFEGEDNGKNLHRHSEIRCLCERRD